MIADASAPHDLHQDPKEQAYLASAKPETRAPMKAKLEQMVGSRKTVTNAARPAFAPNAETIEQLKALGYLR